MKNFPNLEILIVDDDPTIRFLHKISLEMHGFSGVLMEFPDGKLAAEYLNLNKIGNSKYLVLLDLTMPVLNGWGFLEYPLELWGKTAVVIVTSSCNGRDREKAYNYSQVVDYVEKPLNVEETFEEILKKAQDYFER